MKKLVCVVALWLMACGNDKPSSGSERGSSEKPANPGPEPTVLAWCEAPVSAPLPAAPGRPVADCRVARSGQYLLFGCPYKVPNDDLGKLSHLQTLVKDGREATPDEMSAAGFDPPSIVVPAAEGGQIRATFLYTTRDMRTDVPYAFDFASPKTSDLVQRDEGRHALCQEHFGRAAPTTEALP